MLCSVQDFTPVCTSELGRVAQLKDEFAKRNTQVLALSVDTIEHHHEWIKDINEINQVRAATPPALSSGTLHRYRRSHTSRACADSS